MLWTLLALLVMVPAPALAAEQIDGPPRAARVPALEFGIFVNGEFQPRDRIPNQVGLGYCWRARVDSKRPVKWKEEFSLPSAPGTWGSGEVSQDRKTSVQEGEETPDDGVIYGTKWSVAEGDPNGRYQMTVTIGGKVVGTVSFEVEALPGQASPEPSGAPPPSAAPAPSGTPSPTPVPGP